ncbi:MAG: ComEC/Rec2 family competence protein [Chitinophagales bacterium]|nr:ComEC/Rec2 family competence protein [Chitinophagales bacterium]
MDSTRSLWNDAPAVRLLLPLIAGIMGAVSLLHFVFQPLVFNPHFRFIVAYLLLSLALLCGVLLFLNQLKSVVTGYRLRFITGTVVQLQMFIIGWLLVFVHTSVFDRSHLIHFRSEECMYMARITEPPVRKEKTTMAVAELLLKQGEEKQVVSGLVMLQMRTDSNSAKVKYGSEVLFHGLPELLGGPKNPYQFDYGQYQRFHNIYFRVFLKEEAWRIVAQKQGNSLLTAIYDLRDFFLSLIEQHVKTKDELAVASAIMLGYRDYMNADIVQAYASSGALHVLSVSGLHVGILFLALQFLLQWMDKYRQLKWLKVLLVLAVMFFYAVLTGLSPSVLRAVVMFTFFVIAKVLNRDNNMYNVLGVSCLLLLFWNPYLITEIGFKLSYLAVLGIVVLYPILQPILTFKNKILKGAWSITCLSIAAQIATFPISLYYFHQFPNLFLISNLIIIPASDFVLYLGMLICITFKIPFVFKIVGWLFNFLLVWINKFVYFIDSLPFALIEEIQVTQTEMYLIYVIIALALLYYFSPKGKYGVWLLAVFMVYASVRTLRLLQNENQTQIVCYSVPKHTALSFIQNTTAYTAIDSSLQMHESSMLFHIKHHWWALGIKHSMSIRHSDIRQLELPIGQLYVFHGKRILLIDKPVKLQEAIAFKLKLDAIILSGNQRQRMAVLHHLFDTKQYIFDTSNKNWRVKKWKAECDAMHLPYFDVAQYAYVEHLKL